MEDVKVREMQIFDYKKKIAEAETKLKQQQNLYEAVRSDRNLYSKNLIEAQVRWISKIRGLVKCCGNSNMLALELPQSGAKAQKYRIKYELEWRTVYMLMSLILGFFFWVLCPQKGR